MNAHPLADLMPSMSGSDFERLREDIRLHGLNEPIWIFEGQVIDGRHRHRACAGLGIDCPTREFTGDDPHAFVVSQNIHRRHLTGKQRMALIAELLKAKPERSDRQVAEAIGVSNSTVSNVRKEMESSGDVCESHASIDTLGRRQPRDRGKQEPNPPARDWGMRGIPQSEVVTEIKRLLAAGHNAPQISAIVLRDVRHIRLLMNKHGMASPQTKQVGRSSNRIVRETVNAIVATGHGIKLVRRGDISVDREEAQDLLAELLESLKPINALIRILKEVVNG